MKKLTTIKPSKSRTIPSFVRILILIPISLLSIFIQVGRRPAVKLPKLSFDNRKKNVTTNHMVFASCDNDDGIQQQQQQQIPTKDLDFVHIPKTGGSSIELAALHQAQKKWGYFAWKGRMPEGTKYHGDEYGTTFVNWHTPPFLLSSFLLNHNDTTTTTNTTTSRPYYYEKGQEDLFAVIRNPYTRLVSEIYYRCGFRRKDGDCLNKRIVNARTQRDLTLQLNSGKQLDQSTIMDPKVYKSFLHKVGHFVPQWQYFYNRFSGEREIKYLLHSENLAKDFQALMDDYSLNISLGLESGERISNYSNSQPDQFRGVEDFDEKTLRLIVELYQKDFELGGYSLNRSDTTSFSPPFERNVAGNGVGSTYWELPCKIRF